jgi:UDP-N-acetylglucosamine 2-epimerase (non-hydrolysing)
VHTGQNWDYSLNEVFFKDLNIRQPDHYLDAPGQHLGETIGNIISRSYSLLRELKPHALLVLGDTNSALCALSAKRLKIPVFHMEAGNRCFDENVPEEINRRIVDHISDVNLCYTEHSRRYLLGEGIKPDFVFVTHSPMNEVIEKHRHRISDSKILLDLDLRAQEFIVLSTHREENVDQPQVLDDILAAAKAAAEKYGKKIIVTAHPRTKKRLEDRQITLPSFIELHTPFGFIDYLALQTQAFCVMSDSGTLSEESAMLNFPAVLIRTSTERPEVLDEGTMVVGGTTKDSILQAIELARHMFEENRSKLVSPEQYRSKAVSIKVANIIASYTPIVKRRVWGQVL